MTTADYPSIETVRKLLGLELNKPLKSVPVDQDARPNTAFLLEVMGYESLEDFTYKKLDDKFSRFLEYSIEELQDEIDRLESLKKPFEEPHWLAHYMDHKVLQAILDRKTAKK